MPVCKKNIRKKIFDVNLASFDGNKYFKNVRVLSCKNGGFILNDTNFLEEELEEYYAKESMYEPETSFCTGGYNNGDNSDMKKNFYNWSLI